MLHARPLALFGTAMVKCGCSNISISFLLCYHERGSFVCSIFDLPMINRFG